ncbi:MAG: 3-deoxy-manno-octulosonate cytidylyltransferase, partial [Parachlamydiaceae bacterium]
MKKCIAIIPARYESVRFPGKPLAPILGKTLVQHTYENALRCKALQEIVVATDDERIFSHVRAFGGNAVMTSVFCETGTDRLTEVYANYPAFRSDIIVNLQGDEPCVSPETIEKIINLLAQDSQASMATAAVVLNSAEEALSPHIVKCTIDQNQNALYF